VLYPLSYEGGREKSSNRPSAPEHAYAPAVADDVPIVLLVDDEAVLLRMLEVNFRAAGFSVRTAGTGAQAIAAAVLEVPDAVVLDLGLPDVDGRELVAQLRELDGLTETPLLVLSGTDRDGGFDDRYAAEVHAHVTKPFDPAELVEMVRRAIARADA
jgi:DNA-binding response OmpR family regulator